VNNYPSTSSPLSPSSSGRGEEGGFQSAGTPPPASVRISMPNSIPYVTYTIIGLTTAVYILQVVSVWLFGYANDAAQMDWLELYGSKINEFIRAGELWRFLTPILLHASIPHILFNMYALVIFGPTLERYFGRWRFLLLYILGGFTGNVMSFLLSSGYSVGASTAIFGLIGAEGVFLFQNRQLFGGHFRSAIGNIVFIVVVNLLLDLTPGIDIWGHIGGLFGGLIFTWFAGPRWEVEGVYPALSLADRREPREVLTGAAVVILIFGALAMFGMIYPITP
jgi:rhomboid protease GluP